MANHGNGASESVVVPIPPANAQRFQTGCKYCIVGCGYKVFKWPVGQDGGAAASENALQVDLNQPTFTNWISPTMHGVIREGDDRRYNVAIVPDNGCVVNSGLYSVRGGAMGLSVYREDAPTRDRLKHPTIVQHGQQEASWEDAIALVAGVTKTLLDTHGPDAIGVKFADHGGQGGGYEFTWSTGKFFFASVRTTMATVHNRPTVFGEPMASRDMGIPELNIAYEDAEIADTIVIHGANPYANQTNYYFNHMVPNLRGGTIDKKKAAYPGKVVGAGRMIVIDPRETITVNTAREAAGAQNLLHLRVTPGTDIVLMNAIARVILEHGWENRPFIEAHVESSSVSPYVESVGRSRPLDEVLEKAQRFTGVARAQIEQAAQWIAKPIGNQRPATLFHYEKGAIWSIKNYPVIASYVDLAVLTGNLGKPGTGCARLGGHQEGYARPPYPGKRPGIYVEKLLAEGKDPLLWWVISANPAQTAPNASSILRFVTERGRSVTEALDEGGTIPERVKRVVAAVEKGGLFVVATNIYPDEIVKAAHVALPAATQFELNMTSMNGERRIRLYQKFMDPPGEAKPDWEIIALTARRIKAMYEAEGNTEMAARFDGYEWKTDADVFKDAATHSAKSRLPSGAKITPAGLPESSLPTFDPEDIAFLDHDFVLKQGINGIQVPINVKDGRRSGTVRLFADGKFNRPSGRAAFIAAEQPELPEAIAVQKAKYRYLVNNGRFDNMWQTGYESWREPIIAERWGGQRDAFLELHPDDAHEIGVESGDVVRIHNDYATITATVYVVPAVKPKQPFLLFGQPKPNTADYVVTPHVDPETNIESSKLTYADITKVASKPSRMAGVSFKNLENPFLG